MNSKHFCPLVLYFSPLVLHFSPLVLYFRPLVLFFRPLVLHFSPLVLHLPPCGVCMYGGILLGSEGKRVPNKLRPCKPGKADLRVTLHIDL